MTLQNSSHILQQQIRSAREAKQVLDIRGNGTKAFYGYPQQNTLISTRVHSGIVEFAPTELTLTARCGTPLSEISAVLEEHKLMLACDPPRFENATLGGAIAAGLSGPGRAAFGSLSDHILGCRIINGRGEELKFGGKVMKNVAGYDISRLMCGSLGCLGLITEATLRVMPRPAAESTFRFELDQQKVAAFINTLRTSAYPVTASCHDQELLYVRFAGTAREIRQLPVRLHQDFGFIDYEEETSALFWQQLRDQELHFFSGQRNLWRISLPANAPALNLSGPELLEWHGALRWLKSDVDSATVFTRIAALNGQATLFRSQFRQQQKNLFQPLSAPLQNWHEQLKNAFDPDRVFNPGRMYREL